MIKKKDLRNFGLIWAGIFMFIGLIPILKDAEIRIWSIIIAILFLSIALLKPLLFTRFYKIWIRIGAFMGNIFSKVIMFILYFLLFTPVALLLKLLGKDLLNKKLDKSQKSYWIKREMQPQSMKHQF